MKLRMSPIRCSLILLSLCSLLHAQGTAPAEPPAERRTPEFAKEESLRQDPELVVGTLPNGLSYMIRPTAEPKGRMSVRLYVDVGSLNENESNSGISHFIEHLEFNGSRTFKRGELIPAMQRLGLGFGGDANAYTSLEQTVYMLDLPNLKDETVDFAMKIMRDFGDGATMDAEAIEKERGIVVSELKTRDSLAYRAMVNMLDFQLPGTRAAHFLPIGREEIINSITKQQVDDYYGTHYVPENMTVILAGDITVEQGRAWVEKYFGSMERKAKPKPRDIGELKLPRELRAKVFPNPEDGLVTILVNSISPARNEKDTEAQRLKDLPLEMANLMLNLRFAKMARKGDAPFLQAKMDQDTLFKTADVASLVIRCNSEQWKEALEVAERERAGACVYGFSDAEFKEACSVVENALLNSISSWKTARAEAVAAQLIESISDETVHTAPEEDLRIFRKARETMTPKECQEALRGVWRPEGFIPSPTVMATGKTPPDMTDEALFQAYTHAAAKEPARPEAVEEKPFAYEWVGDPGRVVSSTDLDDLGVRQLVLSNGVRVNLKPTPYSQGEILVAAAIDGGRMSQPAGKPGLNALAAAVINQGGLEAHPVTDLQRIFAGRTVASNFSVDDERFFFQGATTPRDLELHLKVLAARILHPGYRPEAEIQFRRMLPAAYARLTHEASGVFRTKAPSILSAGDERFSQPEQREMEKRTSQEVREWLSPWLREGALEVTIIGDFDPEEAGKLVESTLGAMPPRSENAVEVPDARRTVRTTGWKDVRTLTCESSVDKTVVAQILPCGNGRDRLRNRRLQILGRIVKERAFDAIRAELGESYGPTVSVQPRDAYEGFATMTIASSGVLRNRYKVNAAINVIASRLAQGTITQDELDRALKPRLADVEKAKRSNAFWLALAVSQARPEDLELIRGMERDLRSITLDEINALAREVFGSDSAASFYVLPDSVPGHEIGEGTSTPADDPAIHPEAPSEVQAEAGSASGAAFAPGKAGSSGYAVLIGAETARKSGWLEVAVELATRHGGKVLVSPGGIEDGAELLEREAPRYLAVVGRAGEFNRETVNFLHRVTRRFDADPYGDCIWGIVTGSDASAAMRLAEERPPLVVKRAGGTTNLSPGRFETCVCITDWAPFLVQQTRDGVTCSVMYDKQTTGEEFSRRIPKEGVVWKFADMLENDALQLLVTSSHATVYNLEMPFEKGLIISGKGRYHVLTMADKPEYAGALAREKNEGEQPILELIGRKNYPQIKPDGETRIWLAAGNCLFGDAHSSPNSMAITALGSYGCRQLAGYTVPSWYGAAGWGALQLFFGNHDASSFAEACYLNNQFILERTLREYPRLMSVNFDLPELGADLGAQRQFIFSLLQTGCKLDRDAMGLVHDRDVFAFYGDPKWTARLDESREQSPWHIVPGERGLVITANAGAEGRVAFWFPERLAQLPAKAVLRTPAGERPLEEAGVLTNDFLLIRELKLGKGEAAIVEWAGQEG